MTSKWLTGLTAAGAFAIAAACFAASTTQPASTDDSSKPLPPLAVSENVVAEPAPPAAPVPHSTMRIRLYVPPVSATAGKSYSVVAEIVNDGPEAAVLEPQNIQDIASYKSDQANESKKSEPESNGWRLVLLYQNPTDVADTRSVHTQVPPRTVTIPARQSVLLKVDLPPNYLAAGDNLISAVLEYSGTQIAGTDLIGIHCVASTAE